MGLWSNDSSAVGTRSVREEGSHESIAELLKELRSTMGKMELALGAIEEAIVWTDRQGNIQWCNRSFDRLINRAHIQVLGNPLAKLLPLAEKGQRIPPEAYPVQQALTAESVVEERYELNQGDRRLFLRVSATKLDLGEGEEGVILTIYDITRQKWAEEALRQKTEELKRSNQALEEFAYAVSHDLREPLRKVTNYTELLARRYRGRFDSNADKFMGYIVDGTNRMRKLIDDLLTYSRMGRMEISLAPTDVSAVVKEVLSDLEIMIRESKGRVIFDSLPAVAGDPILLRPLLQNLIGNALKFHGTEPPRVEISASHQEGEWIFSVKDNGIGIDPQYFERIFAVFQRLHTRDEYPGTGIGLAVSKRIVERLGGRIWIESEPGRGSTFYFTLPDTKGGIQWHPKPSTSC